MQTDFLTTFQIFSWDGGTLTHQLDLNLNLDIYLFVCFFPSLPMWLSPKILAKDAPPAQTLVCLPRRLLLLVLQTACSHDFVTDFCEPKTEPFWQE